LVTIDLLFQGFPGWSPTYGRLGWPSLTLITAKDKRVLFDTGHTGMLKSLVEKLSERRIDREGIDMLVLSHTHWDHVLGYHLFPNAEIVIGRKELEWALERKLDEVLSIPPNLPRQLAAYPKLKMIDGDTELLPGLTMIETPGHTPGHMSLVAETAKGKIVLAQDAVKYRSEFLTGKADQSIDGDASAASIERVASLADIVVPGHDRPFRVEGCRATYIGESKAEILVKSSPSLEEETIFTIGLR